jgi:tRNA(fMet)-specific endonuclease VapC
VTFLLDTNILIYLMKRTPLSVVRRIDALPAQTRLGMSFVSWAELLKGAERSVRRDEMRQRLDQLARTVPVLYDIDQRLCDHYARHSALLKAQGTPIGGNDLWIACHALSEDATLVTNNLREFEGIAGLRLANWVDS